MKLRIIICAAMVILLAGMSRLTSAAADREKAVSEYKGGNALFDESRFSDAVAAYTRAIGEDSNYTEAFHNRALANEMVDRKAAIQDWRRFIELSADRPELKFDAARAQARLQILEALPALPDTLLPAHYVPAAGDYYFWISDRSEGEEWKVFPLKVFLGSAPEVKWQQGAREAYDNWSKIFPLELVALPKGADIRIGWEESRLGEGAAGGEWDMPQIRYEGGELKTHKYALITIDLSRPWSKDEMRAIVSHEFGHALGIKGHSESKGDIMYWQVQEKIRPLGPPRFPVPLFWKSLVKQPSQRDINTLIRLYNSPGSSKRFK
ncbi:MAG: matrixin family metalloprotease [Terriglobia bacterium]